MHRMAAMSTPGRSPLISRDLRPENGVFSPGNARGVLLARHAWERNEVTSGMQSRRQEARPSGTLRKAAWCFDEKGPMPVIHCARFFRQVQHDPVLQA